MEKALAVFVVNDINIPVGDEIDVEPLLKGSHTKYWYNNDDEHLRRSKVLARIMGWLRDNDPSRRVIIVVDLADNRVVRKVYWTYHEEDY